MLTQRHIQSFLKMITVAKAQLIDFKPACWAHQIEARLALFYMEQYLLSQGKDIEKEWIVFFKGRWDNALVNTDTQYLHDLTNPANQACIAIARELGKILNVSYLGLLMPSLLDVPASDYTTSSYMENDLLWHDLILSDCNTRIIHIPDVLENAQEDGLLKHNSLRFGQAIPLSESEQSRLLSRDVTVKAHYDALKARIAFKLNGDTVGAALARLIHGLRDGGVQGSGKEKDSGAEANEAIMVFHEYLETLDPTIKKQLLEAHTFDRYTGPRPEAYSVEMLWGRLARPDHTDYTETIFCVQIIATRLEDILNQNTWLFDLVSYWGDAPTKLSELNADVMESRVIMNTALPLLKTHPGYGDSRDVGLLSTLVKIIKENRDFILCKEDAVYFAKQHAILMSRDQDTTSIASLLRQINVDYDKTFISEILGELTVDEREKFERATAPGVESLRFAKEDPPCFFQRKRADSKDESSERKHARIF